MTLPAPYFERNGCTLYVGDALATLRELPAASVQCCVTSPPYFNQRDYHCGGQIGLEPTPDAYIAALVAVFAQVRRVLRDDGVCFLNIGDSYAANRPYQVPDSKHKDVGNNGAMRVPDGCKPKDLLLIPFRLALALQADGWWVRQTIIWSKLSAMPESVNDRPTTSHEYIFLLSKQATYFYDAQAIAEPVAKGSAGSTFTEGKTGAMGLGRVSQLQRAEAATRNARSVWTINPRPFSAADLGVEGVDHFAAFPIDLPLRCLRAGTSDAGACAACGAPYGRDVERTRTGTDDRRPDNGMPGRSGHGLTRMRAGDPTVVTTGWRPTCRCADPRPPVPCVALDPFAGAGTTLLAAQRLGRRGIGVELNPDYARIVEARVGRQGVLDFAAEEAAG